jgi:hypothetical protein
MATKRSRWFFLGVLLAAMLLPHLLLAQPPFKGVSFSQMDRLNDRELQQLRGQGLVAPIPQLGQPHAAIKLWDEWANAHLAQSVGNPAKNQVLLFSPPR